ncbi:MAG: hypothetical protein ACNA8N_04885 [Trueperaceae bacterium]
MTQPPASTVRTAILDALPPDTSTHGAPLEPPHLYLPNAHTKALQLDHGLVIGGRGVGKTVWSTALASDELRSSIGTVVPDLRAADVATGHGERPDLDAYPDPATFGSLLDAGESAFHVWRAAIARGLARRTNQVVPAATWVESVAWVRTEPEAFARLLQDADARLRDGGAHMLFVFDALDRAGRDWAEMDSIVRDLLRVALAVRTFPRLHTKVFLREDQFEGRTVTNFPDASKLLATRVELTWALHDLHGLLWQYLVNAYGDHGFVLRSIYTSVMGQEPPSEGGVWRPSGAAQRDSEEQRALFSAIAGPWMGRDRRRGFTYSWSVGHLADAGGRASPRSFLAAIRAAAEDSVERYPDHPHALHYESIKRGVQKASEIRVRELEEDYPWVPRLMQPLRGMTVPCAFSDVEDAWRQAFGERFTPNVGDRLPPDNPDGSWRGLRESLERLGIMERMRDDRVNMPDLYRVGFGLGRRGGVRPVLSTPAG